MNVEIKACTYVVPEQTCEGKLDQTCVGNRAAWMGGQNRNVWESSSEMSVKEGRHGEGGRRKGHGCSKLIARPLATAALGVRIQTSLKNHKWAT
jgi:hypothetical protein